MIHIISCTQLHLPGSSDKFARTIVFLTGPEMGRPKWVEIIKHLQLNGKSLKAFHFRVRTPMKSPKSYLFGSTRLSLPV